MRKRKAKAGEKVMTLPQMYSLQKGSDGGSTSHDAVCETFKR
jgi:hypothetical protein